MTMHGPALAVAAILFMSAGCGTGNHNGRIGLVGIDPLPALDAQEGATTLDPTPSLHGLDRRAWPVVTVKVPIRQVEHDPSYVGFLHVKGQPLFNTRYPSALSALDDGARNGSDLAAAVLDPVYAAGLLGWAPIDMAIVGNWPWNTRRSPDEPYDRLPPAVQGNVWAWVTPESSRGER